jgi:hypothetical protein
MTIERSLYQRRATYWPRLCAIEHRDGFRGRLGPENAPAGFPLRLLHAVALYVALGRISERLANDDFA